MESANGLDYLNLAAVVNCCHGVITLTFVVLDTCLRSSWTLQRPLLYHFCYQNSIYARDCRDKIEVVSLQSLVNSKIWGMGWGWGCYETHLEHGQQQHQLNLLLRSGRMVDSTICLGWLDL